MFVKENCHLDDGPVIVSYNHGNLQVDLSVHSLLFLFTPKQPH